MNRKREEFEREEEEKEERRLMRKLEGQELSSKRRKLEEDLEERKREKQLVEQQLAQQLLEEQLEFNRESLRDTMPITRVAPKPEDQSLRDLRSQLDKNELLWSDVKSLRGDAARNLMQKLMQIREADQHSKASQQCRTLILRLARHSHNVLQSLLLDGVILKSKAPEAGGGFGAVYLGKWQEVDVAVKKLHDVEVVRKKESYDIFCREAASWKQLDHPNILPFYGISNTVFPGQLCFISPWISGGNISDYIRNNPHHQPRELLLQCANGVSYLHNSQPSLVHGDIKPENILVTSEGEVMLCDFGLMTLADDHSRGTHTRQHSMTTRWAAPELLSQASRKTVKTDIYALGMTMFKVFSGTEPFAMMNEPQILIQVVVHKSRPVRPSGPEAPHLTDTIWAMMNKCWTESPEERRGIDEIIEVLLGSERLPNAVKGTAS